MLVRPCVVQTCDPQMRAVKLHKQDGVLCDSLTVYGCVKFHWCYGVLNETICNAKLSKWEGELSEVALVC